MYTGYSQVSIYLPISEIFSSWMTLESSEVGLFVVSCTAKYGGFLKMGYCDIINSNGIFPWNHSFWDFLGIPFMEIPISFLTRNFWVTLIHKIPSSSSNILYKRRPPSQIIVPFNIQVIRGRNLPPLIVIQIWFNLSKSHVQFQNQSTFIQI